MIIHVASVTTRDRLDKAYILLNSIKKNKQPDTEVDYYLFVQYAPDFQELDYFVYLKDLMSSDFRIHLYDVDQYKNKVHAPARDHIYYARLLFPNTFPQLSRLIYIDIDAFVIRPGIEDFFTAPVDDAWLGAVIDPTWQYCGPFMHELKNTGTDHYFNNGVIVMNFDKMREDGKDKEMADWCNNWDRRKLQCICFDQTLMNYLLKDKVKLLNSKYTCSVMASLEIAQTAYAFALNQEGWLNPLDSVDHAIIVHFCGQNKPWNANSIPDLYYPYKNEAVECWNQIQRKYGKK